jgi:predicted MFS family arabinose efflux permease
MKDVVDGLRFLHGHVVIRTLTGLAAVANFTTFMTLSTMVLFATEITGLDERGYGLLLGAGAVGGAVGAVVSTTVVKRVGLRSTLLVVPFIAPVAFLLVGLFGRDPVLLAAMLAAAAFALALWNVVSFTLRQLLVPSEMLGRVGGAAKMIAFGAGPLGALAGGLVAQQWGLVAPWIVAGLLRLAIALVMVPMLHRQRIIDPIGATGPRRGRHRQPSRTPGRHSRRGVDQRPH